MQGDWWYSVNEARKGPVSIDALRTMMLEGKVSASTLVWKEGFPAWAPLSEIAELESVVRAVPPELPRLTGRDQIIALPLAGPWRRFFARFIDLSALSLPTAFMVTFALSRVSTTFNLWIQQPGSEFALGWLLMPLVLMLEAAVFAILGTTPGKALMGVKVTTADAQHPTAAQYLRRQVGVYWYGLGTGFPLISLFTMARQRSRLKAGGHTRYDEGRFNVKAPKLGFLRGIAATTIVVGLLAVNAVLQQLSRESARGYHSGITWTNEVSGKSVAVPRGWRHEKQQNEEKQSINIFSGPDYGVFVVFAKEDAPPAMDLKTYVATWVLAVQETMRLPLPGQQALVGSHDAVIITGTLTDDRSQRVHATFIKKGRQMWRVVMLSNPGKDPASEQSMKLQALLFKSID